MAGEPDWVPPGVDPKRANVARVYDYWLGGDPGQFGCLVAVARKP
jgi:hypothetical protein